MSNANIYCLSVGIISTAGNDSWPELVQKDEDYAASVIEKENPTVKAVVILKGSPMTSDLRFDRVRVIVNYNRIVVSIPVIS
ncbi:Protease inhibitor HPI [Cardamine amara subsp. amara]|uniref:Protease inhibitor HPI n=1 Tax=Cardamine amara subsp. amara TaxID=228776 RepID=A0ABD1A6M0_CARAN